MRKSDLDDIDKAISGLEVELVRQTRIGAFQEVMFHLKGQADHERRLYGGPSSGLVGAMLIVNQLLQEATHG